MVNREFCLRATVGILRSFCVIEVKLRIDDMKNEAPSMSVPEFSVFPVSSA